MVSHKYILVSFVGEEDQDAVSNHVHMAKDLDCLKPIADAVVYLWFLPVHASHVVNLRPDLHLVADDTE